MIIDSSGSMETIKSDMEGGFNNFIDKQKKIDGKATMTLTTFNSDIDIEFTNKDLTEVDNLKLNPKGMTALLDAIGMTLNKERERIMSMDSDEKPEKVICVIITDGAENSSKKHSREEIFEMISSLENEKEDTKWNFVFLGANQDAIQTGGSIGTQPYRSLTYDASSEGATVAFSSLSNATVQYRCSNDSKAEYTFDQKDRDAQEKIKNNPIPNYISNLSGSQ